VSNPRPRFRDCGARRAARIDRDQVLPLDRPYSFQIDDEFIAGVKRMRIIEVADHLPWTARGPATSQPMDVEDDGSRRCGSCWSWNAARCDWPRSLSDGERGRFGERPDVQRAGEPSRFGGRAAEVNEEIREPGGQPHAFETPVLAPRYRGLSSRRERARHRIHSAYGDRRLSTTRKIPECTRRSWRRELRTPWCRTGASLPVFIAPLLQRVPPATCVVLQKSCSGAESVARCTEGDREISGLDECC